MKMNRFVFPVILILIFNCQKYESKDSRQKLESFADIYASLAILQESPDLSEEAKFDSSKSILLSHHLTQPMYDSLLAEINKDQHNWIKFYRLVQTKLHPTDSK